MGISVVVGNMRAASLILLCLVGFSQGYYSGQCLDKKTNCPGWVWHCTNGQYQSWMSTNCPKTCGKCTTGGSDGGSVTGCAKIPSWMKTAMAGTSGFERIIQGQQAPAPIPWQAHMRQGSPTGGFSYFCGGTILDAKTILTAAHCYYQNPTASNYFIAAGATHVTDSSAQVAYVESITLHPSYNHQTINNDVAIVKLKTALTFNNKVQPACLPAASLTPSGIAVASGWGLVGQEPDQGTHNLMYVTKPVILNTQCRNTKWAPSQITDKMICAGDADGGQSTCKGDSGGPLVIAGSGDVATVIGTTSFGPAKGCGAQGLPAVYAYTVPFLDWIKARMG